MKFFLVLILGAVLFCQQLKAGWYIPEGIFFTYATLADIIIPKTETLDDIIILGDAVGEAELISVLGLVTVGDMGIEAAKKDALKAYPQADDIINIEVDERRLSILYFIFSQTEITLRGKAIKYKKPLPAVLSIEKNIEKHQEN